MLALPSSAPQRLTWPTSATPTGPRSARYPASYPRPSARRRAALRGLGFLLPFGHRHWLLGPSCSRPRDRPSSRSAHRTSRPGPGRGFHVPHAQDPAGEGAAYTPGRRCSHDRSSAPVAACRFATASPAPRCRFHLPGAHLDEVSSAVHSRSPVRPSPHLPSPDGTRTASASAPRLRTPPLPATHARVGTGHRTLTRATSSTSPPTSNSTRHLHMRPRVAPLTRCPSWSG